MLHALATYSLLPNESKNKYVTVQICPLLTVTDLSVTPSLCIYYSLTPPVPSCSISLIRSFFNRFLVLEVESVLLEPSTYICLPVLLVKEMFLIRKHQLISVTFACDLIINLLRKGIYLKLPVFQY